VFDYRDTEVELKIKSALSQHGKPLKYSYDCVGADDSVLDILEKTVEQGGDIILALPPIREMPRHHSEMAVAGTVCNLTSFEMPSFKFIGGVDPPTDVAGAVRLQEIIRWALNEAGRKYIPPKVRRLSGKGLFDALEAFELMKAGKISGEKVVYRISETPDI
jgi:hypothetical protein